MSSARVALEPQADQRQEQRHQISQSAIVSILGAAGEVIHGEIRNVSNGGTQIRLNQPIKYASLVMIDYDDNRLLGEVIYCEKQPAGWLVGIQVEHVLLRLSTLASIGQGY